MPTELERHVSFLFSDSNLAKDVALVRLLWPSGPPFPGGPRLHLSQLLAFPRVRSLSRGSLAELRQAALASPAVVLSLDGALVGRAAAYQPPPPGYYDSRTLFVDRVPQGLGREALQVCFSQWGPLAYVSLPKDRRAPAGGSASSDSAAASSAPRAHKGFAFIEYERTEDALGALAAIASYSGEGDPPLPLHLANLSVMSKATWGAYKRVYKEAGAAAQEVQRGAPSGAAAATASSAASSAAAAAFPSGALLRLEGLPPTIPFSTLSAVCSAPAGRPCHIDAPELFSNGLPPPSLVRTGAGATWAGKCLMAVHLAATSGPVGTGSAATAAAAAAAAASGGGSAAVASAAAACAGAGGGFSLAYPPPTAALLEEEDRLAASAAPSLLNVTVRYKTAEQAEAALRAFTGGGSTSQQLILGGHPIACRILQAGEEAAYFEMVQREVAGYASRKKERQVGRGAGGGGGGGGASAAPGSSSGEGSGGGLCASPRKGGGGRLSGGGGGGAGRKRGRSPASSGGKQGGEAKRGR